MEVSEVSGWGATASVWRDSSWSGHYRSHVLKRVPRRRNWQSTPGLSPRKLHEGGSLGSYSPWGRRNWQPLQGSRLENSMEGGVWGSYAYGITEMDTLTEQLSTLLRLWETGDPEPTATWEALPIKAGLLTGLWSFSVALWSLLCGLSTMRPGKNVGLPVICIEPSKGWSGAGL